MSEVKRYQAVHIRYEDSNIRYGEGCEVDVVAAYDYDKQAQEIERLTAELERVKRAPVLPDGWALAPQEIHLGASDIELITGMCGDGNEGSGYGSYQDGTLVIGYALQDDGSRVYGLHISCDECPEEGVTTLAEFVAPPPIPATQVLVGRELLEGLIDPFCDGSEAHQRARAILSSKGGDV